MRLRWLPVVGPVRVGTCLLKKGCLVGYINSFRYVSADLGMPLARHQRHNHTTDSLLVISM